jgi:hypothetical protein
MVVVNGRTGAFLSLSVCHFIYAVELWKKEGPPPARKFW